MMTLEQYLNVAYMWQAEKSEGYNPFEGLANWQDEFMGQQDFEEGSVADDGWVDYPDNVNTIPVEEEKEKHAERFDPAEFNKSVMNL